MKILALDTSGDTCAVALTEEFLVKAEYRLYLKNMHNEKLVGTIQALANDLGWKLSDFEGIALSIGPGSFTGLRIGISAAKGLAFSLDIPIVTINSLDAMASGIPFWKGTICTVVKAREKELYVAFYECDGVSSEIRRVSDYQIVTIDAFHNLFKKEELVVCSPYSIQETLANKHSVFAPREFSTGNAHTVAKLGLQKFEKGETVDTESLEPFYLKEFIPRLKSYA